MVLKTPADKEQASSGPAVVREMNASLDPNEEFVPASSAESVLAQAPTPKGAASQVRAPKAEQKPPAKPAIQAKRVSEEKPFKEKEESAEGVTFTPPPLPAVPAEQVIFSPNSVSQHTPPVSKPKKLPSELELSRGVVAANADVSSRVSPSVSAIAGDYVWVRTSEKRTVRFKKGESVPGLGEFKGADGDKAHFDKGTLTADLAK
ncbi:hypothetical protein LC612_28510 [Nostoc sp. CHAB 5834]|nr:hypothetical protein [Nostoc sp. CHAB 5834]